MKTTSLLNRRLPLALGAAILASLAASVISYRSMVTSSESNQWVRHTRDVLEKPQDLLTAMPSAERIPTRVQVERDSSGCMDKKSLRAAESDWLFARRVSSAWAEDLGGVATRRGLDVRFCPARKRPEMMESIGTDEARYRNVARSASAPDLARNEDRMAVLLKNDRRRGLEVL
jgi:hypothetical protein